MYEIDVFSIDEDGNVVVTTTVADEDTENNSKIGDFIMNLPNISGFVRVREDKYDFSDWDSYDKKGLIAYDDYHGTNILTSIPIIHLTIDDLPMDIIKLFKNENI